MSSKDAVFTHIYSIADINYVGRLRELLEEIFGICKLLLMVYRRMIGTLQLLWKTGNFLTLIHICQSILTSYWTSAVDFKKSFLEGCFNECRVSSLGSVNFNSHNQDFACRVENSFTSALFALSSESWRKFRRRMTSLWADVISWLLASSWIWIFPFTFQWFWQTSWVQIVTAMMWKATLIPPFGRSNAPEFDPDVMRRGYGLLFAEYLPLCFSPNV